MGAYLSPSTISIVSQSGSARKMATLKKSGKNYDKLIGLQLPLAILIFSYRHFHTMVWGEYAPLVNSTIDIVLTILTTVLLILVYRQIAPKHQRLNSLKYSASFIFALTAPVCGAISLMYEIHRQISVKSKLSLSFFLTLRDELHSKVNTILATMSNVIATLLEIVCLVAHRPAAPKSKRHLDRSETQRHSQCAAIVACAPRSPPAGYSA